MANQARRRVAASRRKFRFTAALTLPIVVALALGSGGCTSQVEPAMDARESLGTIVTVTAYPASEYSAEDLARGIDTAYEAMADAEVILDAHARVESDEVFTQPAYEITHGLATPVRTVSEFNVEPQQWHTLPPEIIDILVSIDSLRVYDSFSPALLEVTALYEFEEGGVVPDSASLQYHVAAANTLEMTSTGGAVLIPVETALRFDWDSIAMPATVPDVENTGLPSNRAGLDLGGAAKGYALDAAAGQLAAHRAISSALITAGSTTVTFGQKPDKEPWRIGVEHPRDTDGVIATVEAEGDITVSTSGDYQRYFESGGVRYHHILDPKTGQPTRGLQSLTVVGAPSGLQSDILATALFVMGPEEATRYAEESGLGLVIVDEEGRVQITPGPPNRSWEIVAE